MIMLAAFVLIVVSVPLLKGDMNRMGLLRVQSYGLILVAMALQVLITTTPQTWYPGKTAEILHLATYGMAVGFLWFNRKVPGLWMLGVGGLMNLTALLANGGIMPAWAWAVEAAGMTHDAEAFRNSFPLKNPRLLFLGDVIPVPIPNRFLRSAVSIGDLLMVAGATCLFHGVTRSKLAPTLGRFGRFYLPETSSVALEPTPFVNQPERDPGFRQRALRLREVRKNALQDGSEFWEVVFDASVYVEGAASGSDLDDLLATQLLSWQATITQIAGVANFAVRASGPTIEAAYTGAGRSDGSGPNASADPDVVAYGVSPLSDAVVPDSPADLVRPTASPGGGDEAAVDDGADARSRLVEDDGVVGAVDRILRAPVRDTPGRYDAGRQ